MDKRQFFRIVQYYVNLTDNKYFESFDNYDHLYQNVKSLYPEYCQELLELICNEIVYLNPDITKE